MARPLTPTPSCAHGQGDCSEGEDGVGRIVAGQGQAGGTVSRRRFMLVGAALAGLFSAGCVAQPSGPRGSSSVAAPIPAPPEPGALVVYRYAVAGREIVADRQPSG